MLEGVCISCGNQGFLRESFSSAEQGNKGICPNCYPEYNAYYCEICPNSTLVGLDTYKQHIIDIHKNQIERLAELVSDYARAKKRREY